MEAKLVLVDNPIMRLVRLAKVPPGESLAVGRARRSTRAAAQQREKVAFGSGARLGRETIRFYILCASSSQFGPSAS